eukprot:4742861-Pleurochrysis_carterae.AAC.1
MPSCSQTDANFLLAHSRRSQSSKSDAGRPQGVRFKVRRPCMRTRQPDMLCLQAMDTFRLVCGHAFEAACMHYDARA